MTSGQFQASPTMKILHLIAAVLLAGNLPLVAAPKKGSQVGPGKPSTPAPEKPSSTGNDEAQAPLGARLRVWKAEFASKRTVHLMVKPAAKRETPLDLGDLTPELRIGDYTPASSGECSVEVAIPGAAGAPLATFPTHIPDSGWGTLIIRESEAGALSFEMVDDAPKGNGETSELLVRNFVPALKSLVIDGGADLHVRLETPECFTYLRGIPRVNLEVKASVEPATGAKVNWTNGVNFAQFRRATLLIVADRTGRIRPRMVVDAPGFGKPLDNTTPADSETPKPEATPAGPQ